VPLLAPSDGVPFACFLTLHSTPAISPGQGISASLDQQTSRQAAAQNDLQELVYVLAGNAQVKSIANMQGPRADDCRHPEQT